MEITLPFPKDAAPWILEVIVLSSLSLLVFLAASISPLFGSVLYLFTPLSLTLLSLRRGLLGAGAGLLVALLVFGRLSSLSHATAFVLEFGGMALILAEGIRRGWGGEKTVFWGAALAGAGNLLILGRELLKSGMGLFAFIDREIVARLAEVREVFGRAGLPASAGDFLGNVLLQSYPSLLALSISLASILNYYAAKRLCGRSDGEARKGDRPFSSWSIGEWWVWGLIAGLALYLLPHPFRRAGLNLLLFFLGLYLVQGLAIASWFFQRWKVSPIPRILFYLLVLLQPFLLLLLAGVGLSDLWVTFRRTPRETRSEGKA